MEETWFFDCDDTVLEVEIPRARLFEFYSWADEFGLKVKHLSKDKSLSADSYFFKVGHPRKDLLALAKLSWQP